MTEFLKYISELGPYELIGVAGFFFYISPFCAVQLGWLDGNSTTYSLCNVIAASLVAISLIQEFNLASALIQGSWIVIGLVGLALRTVKTWPNARRVLTATLDTEVL